MDDSFYFNIAINLARDGLGKCAPNPAVGCVLVRGGRVLAVGRTQNGGRPHAEQMALRQLLPNNHSNQPIECNDISRNIAKGAVAYITLEPCASRGVTESCAKLLVWAGIKRAVIGQIDPDPKTAGNGMAYLQKNGVECQCMAGELGKNAQMINRGFVLTCTHNRPLLAVKMATSHDYFTINAQSPHITSPAMRHFGRILRDSFDAIMVGGATIRADNPALTIRDGLAHLNRPRIIVTRNLAGIKYANILQPHPQPVIIFTNRANAPMPNHIRVIECDDNENFFHNIFTHCSNKLGLTRILIETGGGLIAPLLHHNLIDEFFWFRANDSLAIHGKNLLNMTNFAGLTTIETRHFADGMMTKFINL